LVVSKPPQSANGPEGASGATRGLAERIAQARQNRAQGADRASGDEDARTSGLARGLRIGSEFVAGILVGAGLGYLVDLGLNTSPWGMLTLFMVGFAAGIRNVIRAVAEMNAAASSPPPPAAAGRDAEND
jgi:ATP synthase protein I